MPTILNIPLTPPKWVNLRVGQYCKLCKNYTSKGKPMWKYSDDTYMCNACKVHYEDLVAKNFLEKGTPQEDGKSN